ncbi:MAG TPA: RHS repeat-associated core domain-containing protein, partial [Streptosporangiaceae bacterium]
TRRYYDPYGNNRGAPAASFPTGEKGFIGGATDSATGLTDLGAREYQPETGSFVSTDPLINPYDPQDLNAYAYATDNPTTYSDPTGACVWPQFAEAPSPACGGNPDPGQGSGGSNGENSTRGTTSSPVCVDISPHVCVPPNSKSFSSLKKAWDWVVSEYGKPANATQEMERWRVACFEVPSACRGQWYSDVGAILGSKFDQGLVNSWNMGMKTLLGYGNIVAGVIIPNKLSEKWEQEQSDPANRNVPKASPSDPEWRDIIRSNSTIKWAVLDNGDLVIMPKWVNGTEVPHSLLSGGEGVQAAGEADIAWAPGEQEIGIDINDHTGHYYEDTPEFRASLQIGVDAFADAGVTFLGWDYGDGGGPIDE